MKPKSQKIVAHGKTSKFPGNGAAPTMADFRRIKAMLEKNAIRPVNGFYSIAVDQSVLTPEFREKCKRLGMRIVETPCPTSPPKPN